MQKSPEYTVSQRRDLLLRVADTLWSFFVVTPLVVFYWSGTWKLTDTYILPDSTSKNPLLSSYVSLGIGIAVGLSGYLLLPVLSEHLTAQCSWKHVLVSRIFSYVYGFGILNFWRGVWNVTNHLAGTDLMWSLICYGISKLVLILLRSVSSCLSSPFVIVKDHRDDFYKAYTLCRSDDSLGCRYIMDSVVTHIGVTHLCIQVWRALWNIMHNIILPDESLLLKSYLVSLGAGYGVCLLLFLLQHPFYALAKKLRLNHWILEHILEVLVKMAATFACVLLWRGGWGLCRDFLLTKEWHFWLAHGLGAGLLLVVQSSGTIGIPSVAVDCEFGWGTGQYYPVDFFLLWYYRRSFQRLSVQVPEDSDSNNSEEERGDQDLLVG